MKTTIKPTQSSDRRGIWELDLTHRHYETLQALVMDVLASVERCATWSPQTMPAAIIVTKDQRERLIPEAMETMISPVNAMEIIVEGLDGPILQA